MLVWCVQMESDVTVLQGRVKAVCETCSQTVSAINSAAELHAELSARIKLSRSVASYCTDVLFVGPILNFIEANIPFYLSRKEVCK